MCLMGPQDAAYTVTDPQLIPSHLEVVHAKIFTAQYNYKTLAQAELQRYFYYSSELFLSYLLC